jgi:hypothetical protein
VIRNRRGQVLTMALDQMQPGDDRAPLWHHPS